MRLERHVDGERLRHRPEHLLDLIRDDLLRLADGNIEVEAAGATLLGDRGGSGLQAEVGREQEIVEIVERRGVYPPLGQDGGMPS